MFDKYYPTAQLHQLQERASAIGEAKLQAYENDWQKLIDLVRVEMENGTDPASERVQRLARSWRSLVEAFTGGDPGISQSLKNMYSEEGPEEASRGAVDQTLSDYIGKAMANLDL